MTVLIIILIVLAVVAVGLVQVQARSQHDVTTLADVQEAAAIVEAYFGLIWTPVNGPGEYNFRPKLRAYAPTISIRTEPEESGGTTVSIWTSSFTTHYGLMGHAALMLRKKRGLAKRLTARQLEADAA
jgi:hypothetical protein